MSENVGDGRGGTNSSRKGHESCGPSSPPPPATAVIIGGGIAGLVLALCLNEHCGGLIPEVYEAASSFEDGIGGGIGLYPNGLRVLRDISSKLLSKIRWEGYPHVWRRWYRHDGSEVARARESALTPSKKDGDVLSPMSIRRWKLQQILYEECLVRGIRVEFKAKVSRTVRLDDGMVRVFFENGKSRRTRLLFGADGIHSVVRDAVLGRDGWKPEYTGVTCLIGVADVHRPVRGICFPSSLTTHAHMSTYPTGEGDTVFEMYFPTPKEPTDNWGKMNPRKAKQVCSDLADQLERDGWNAQFVRPIRQADPNSVVRLALYSSRDIPKKWVDDGGRIVLLGDAAHPSVPYLGQGAQLSIEDAGTLALLVQHFCCNPENVNNDDIRGGRAGSDFCEFSLSKIDEALEVYERMRIPRAGDILGKSYGLGQTQQRRADSSLYNAFREVAIRAGVWWSGTLPVLLPAATYDYRAGLETVLEEHKESHRVCQC